MITITTLFDIEDEDETKSIKALTQGVELKSLIELHSEKVGKIEKKLLDEELKNEADRLTQMPF